MSDSGSVSGDQPTSPGGDSNSGDDGASSSGDGSDGSTSPTGDGSDETDDNNPSEAGSDGDEGDEAETAMTDEAKDMAPTGAEGDGSDDTDSAGFDGTEDAEPDDTGSAESDDTGSAEPEESKSIVPGGAESDGSDSTEGAESDGTETAGSDDTGSAEPDESKSIAPGGAAAGVPDPDSLGGVESDPDGLAQLNDNDAGDRLASSPNGPTSGSGPGSSSPLLSPEDISGLNLADNMPADIFSPGQVNEPGFVGPESSSSEPAAGSGAGSSSPQKLWYNDSPGGIEGGNPANQHYVQETPEQHEENELRNSALAIG
jgi:hypothetical protein